MRRVFNRAFAGHWIENLSTKEWQERFTATQQFKLGLAKLALLDDRLIGLYLGEALDNQPGCVGLEIVGVLPEHRGRGLETHSLQMPSARISRPALNSAARVWMKKILPMPNSCMAIWDLHRKKQLDTLSGEIRR